MAIDLKDFKDLRDLKDLRLGDLVAALRGQAARRASGLVGEGRVQARRMIGGHGDAALWSAFSVGIVVGSLIGAAVALLLAPLSGAEARRRLSERASRRTGEMEWERAAGDGHPAAPTYSTGRLEG